MSEQTETKPELTCGAVLAHLCRGKAAGATLRCGAPATVRFVHPQKGQVGRCDEHAGWVDLTVPENKGWSRAP